MTVGAVSWSDIISCLRIPLPVGVTIPMYQRDVAAIPNNV